MADRVLAMYLGEYVAEGTAEEVMRNETVRRVYLGGAIEVAARPEISQKRGGRRCWKLQMSACSTARRRRLDKVSLHVKEGEFVSVVGLNGAGKTTLFNAISGLVPYSGTIKWGGAIPRAGAARRPSPARGIVQCAGDAAAVRRHERARKSRSRRLASARRPRARSSSTGCSRCSRSCADRQSADGQHPLGRRAADAGDRPRADDAAEICCSWTSRRWASRR